MLWPLTHHDGNLTQRQLGRALDTYLTRFTSPENFAFWKLTDFAWTNRLSRFEFNPLDMRMRPDISARSWAGRLMRHVDVDVWLAEFGSSPLNLVSFDVIIEFDLDGYMVERDAVGMREGELPARIHAEILDDRGHRQKADRAVTGRFHLCHAQWMER